MRAAHAFLTSIVTLGAGCLDSFRGASFQIDMSPGTPAQASAFGGMVGNDLPAGTQFHLYAVREEPDRDNLFEIFSFEIHRVVDLNSPCFIDADAQARYPGLHVSQFLNRLVADTGITDIANPPAGASDLDQIDVATAMTRMSNLAALAGDPGLKVISTASSVAYPPVDADCTGTGLPPSTCIDDASNLRRLAICRETWGTDAKLFEGTDIGLSAPINGTTLGFVNGVNPINLSPVGGGQFVIEESLVDVDEFAIFVQMEGTAGIGDLFLSGRPTRQARGVSHVEMTHPTSPNITASVGIFTDLGTDNVNF